ncbi:hypothetical protein J2R98_001185 [Alkalibacillus filiformis]|uniref:Uncharacterized protein n=1 Tax=Alkalibacillus filiformis TaxID=200990 RepID=A0ABU0DST4_9BACI|nr:hypothetical protein [Alkalibacillus filiformis]MDQ0351371.1 hypothetical protein [Alkalibacillus filiformis]
MKFLKNIDSNDILPYISTTGLILIICSVILPVPVIMLVQDLLFFSYDQTSFIRPTEAYLGFGGAMLLIALILFSFLFTKMYYDKKDKEYNLTAVHLVLFVLSIVLLILPIYHYHYFDDQGVHSNTYWTFSEESIAWDDITEVSREVNEEDYAVLSYTFSNDEQSITIPFDYSDNDTNRTINYAVDAFNWDVEDEFVEG